MYHNGQGVAKDLPQAMAWYRKVADQGVAIAQDNLGWMYTTGEGVPKDFVTAYMWFNLAAAQGVENAKINRDAIEKQMSAQQIAEAQRLGRERTTSEQGLGAAQGAMANKRFIPMMQEGGVYKVPVFINNEITLNFIVDSGASDVSIPADVVTTLMRTGTITQSDFMGTRTYALADGSTTSSLTFRIRSLQVGDIVLQDVIGSMANQNGDLLLGQSFLGRFKSWSIDNTKHALVLGDRLGGTSPQSSRQYQ